MNDNSQIEKVLCLSRRDFPVEWLGERAVVRMDEEFFFNTFSSDSGFQPYWIDRPSAEQNRSFKQLIPYVLIQAEMGALTAIYRRGGGESRLHDLWSMGIGGHINPSDTLQDSYSSALSGQRRMDEYPSEDKIEASVSLNGETDLRQLLYSGMERELGEELLSRPHGSLPLFLGTINEESTDVGKVHFGVVFKIMADSPESFIPGEELLDFQWIKTETLFKGGSHDFNMELWSQMAVDLFE